MLYAEQWHVHCSHMHPVVLVPGCGTALSVHRGMAPSMRCGTALSVYLWHGTLHALWHGTLRV